MSGDDECQSCGEARWWCSIWSDAEPGMRSYGTEMSYKSSLMSVIFQLQSVTQPPAPPMTELASGHTVDVKIVVV